MNIKEIYIIDIETDGLNSNLNSILEIGIVKLNFLSGEILPLFTSLVQEGKLINSNAWIFKNSSLNFLDVIIAPALNDIRKNLQKLLLKGYFTAFNQKFDFKWLEDRKFKIPLKWLDPMLILTPIINLKHNYYKNKYPKVEEAYNYLFNKNIIEMHRALSDAIIEAKIILKMYQKNLF